MAKYINHAAGQVAGDGTTTATARAYGNGLSLSAGDDIRALATLPVDTGLGATWECRNDKIIVDSQSYFLPFMFHDFKRAYATWTRSGTTVTVTKTSHGLSTNDWISLSANTSSSDAAMSGQIYQITVSDGDTFTFTGVNAGATSGWLMYSCKLCEPDRYFTWTRSGTTITCTTYNAHGQGSITTNINCIISNATTTIIQTTIKSATFSSTNTFTFTDANTGVTAGGGFYEHGWTASANVTSTVAVTSGMRNIGCRNTLVAAAGFTTGLMGYVKLAATLDISSYQMISMQWWPSLVQTGLRFVLCSDTAGATPITGCDWKIYPDTPVVSNRPMAITLTPYSTATIWTASQAVNVNDLRYTRNHVGTMSGVYKCTSNGTCGTAEPIWNTDGSTITDNTTTWVFDGYKNLPNNVASVAIYADVDPLLMIVGFEFLTAFKAPTDATCLTFEHLVLPTPDTAIARNTGYNVGDIRVPSPSFGSNMRYICTTAGTSHASTEPTWNHLYSSLTTDGTAVFKNIGFQETPYSIHHIFYLDSTQSCIVIHDGGGGGSYQGSATVKTFALGYYSPIFPPLLTDTAEVSDSSITVENASGFLVNDIIEISAIDDYTVISVDVSTNVIGVSPNIATERAIGQPVRACKRVTDLYKIRPHYNGYVLGITASNAMDYFNSSGTVASPITYTGGYDATYTNVVGRTYVYGFNHASYYGYSHVTNKGYFNIYNMHYVGFLHGINPQIATATDPDGRYSTIRNCGAVACNGGSFYSRASVSPGDIIFLEYFTISTTCTSTEPYVAFIYGSNTVRVKGLYIVASRQLLYNWQFILCAPGSWVSNSTWNFYGGENFFDEVYLNGSSQTVGNHGINGGILPLFVRNLKTDFVYSGAVSGFHIQHRFHNLLDRSTSGGVYLPVRYAALAASYAPWIISEKHQGVEESTRWEQYGAVVISDTSIANFYWKCSITSSTYYDSVMPCRLPIPIRISVTDGVSCSFKVKMRRTHTNMTCGVQVKMDYNYMTDDNGVDLSDVTTLMTAAADTDEDVTVTFTPNRTGYIEAKIIGYSSDATSSFYVGQVTKLAG